MRIDINSMSLFRPLIDNPNNLANSKGVYIISAPTLDILPESLRSLSFARIEDRYILYVGLSKRGIKSRDYKSHFNGNARNSTFRKSLGSIFQLQREILDDKGRYRFVHDDEAYLSKWMKEHLYLHYLICEEIEEIEKELIQELNPPLNLKDNHNTINLEFRKLLRAWRNK